MTVINSYNEYVYGVGAIDAEWFDGLETNLPGSDCTVADLIGRYINAPCDIGDDLTVWIPAHNCFLSQFTIDEICTTIDNS